VIQARCLGRGRVCGQVQVGGKTNILTEKCDFLGKEVKWDEITEN